MADNIVGGLFGVDPQQLMRQRQQADIDNAYKFASLDQMGQAQFNIARGAAGLGRAVGGLLGGDPELEKVSKIKQLSSQFDLTTPQGMRQFAQQLQQFAPNEAMMAAKRADEMMATQEQTALRSAQTQQAEAGKIIQVDLGDKVQLVNALTKEVIREIPKGMTAAQSAKQEAADTAQKEAASNILDSAVEGKTLVSNIKQQVGYNTVGIGSALSWVPMTEAKKFSADLATLKSQLTLAAMNAAKSQSKTGATGFGALNSKELKVLQDNIAALDTGLSPEDFNAKLDEVTGYFNKLEQKATKTLQPKGTSPSAPDTGEFADDYKKYKEKYGAQAMPYNAYVSKRKGS